MDKKLRLITFDRFSSVVRILSFNAIGHSFDPHTVQTFNFVCMSVCIGSFVEFYSYINNIILCLFQSIHVKAVFIITIKLNEVLNVQLFYKAISLH
jgi:hypothetical protein